MGLFRFLTAAAYWLQDQFDWMLRNIVFPAQIVFMLMASWGLVGAELGVERLFWSEDPLVQASSGFTVGMLFGVILFVWYLLDPPTRFVNYVAPLPPAGAQPRFWSLLPSATSPQVRRFGGYLLWAMPLLLLAIVVGKVLVTLGRSGTPDVPAVPGAANPVQTHFAGRLFLVPGVVGYLLSMGLAWLLYKTDEMFGIRDKIGDAPVFRKLAGFTSGRVPEADRPLHAVMMYLVGVSLMFILFAVISVIVLNAYYPGMVLTGPVALVCLLFILFNEVYGFWSRHVNLGTVVLFAAAIPLMLWNSPSVFPEADYKVRFPGLEPEYDKDKRVHLDLIDDDGRAKGAGNPAAGPLLADATILANVAQRWHDAGGDPQRLPKIVVVAVSGGGIRSAVWTASVLETLEAGIGEKRDAQGKRTQAAFRDHLRMFTGASGGMVGASLYVADFDRGRPDRGDATFYPPAPNESKLGLYSDVLAEQSLLPTFQTAALRDFSLNLFVPPWQHVSYDRGRALEEKWALNARSRGLGPGNRAASAAELRQLKADGKRLSPFNRTFADLYELEAKGQRPSLLFSPMLVEDSRRLLVGNLDAGELAVARGPVAKGGQGAARTEAVYSRSGLELFKLFPAAHDRFEVGTAARMSATFPVISPAASLPTVPARRVVDAGYFDNYGVDLAAMWLINNKPVLDQYVGGVALVEIRAFPLQERGLTYPPNDPSYAEAAGVLADTVGALSTPLRAVLRATMNACYHRNNELLATLDSLYNTGEQASAEPFRRFVFELNVDAALNWYLSAEEKKGIARAVGDPKIAQEAAALADWLGDGGGGGPRR